mmetsp:Transcript_31464/g.41944  ORF Transcript_31464/g.41944 Transcript_31464/m.41944 type:complete len:212 (+) Transcript_31464:2676-3311(+)
MGLSVTSSMNAQTTRTAFSNICIVRAPNFCTDRTFHPFHMFLNKSLATSTTETFMWISGPILPTNISPFSFVFTLFAINALATYPESSGHTLKGWIKKIKCKCAITHFTIQQLSFVFWNFSTNLTNFTIWTAPCQQRRIAHTVNRSIATERMVCFTTIDTEKHSIHCSTTAACNATIHPCKIESISMLKMKMCQRKTRFWVRWFGQWFKFY